MKLNDPINQDADYGWFLEDRFGLFLHWGLYSVPARHEWIQKRESIPHEAYDRYRKYFKADRYDPTEWARMAKAAGMRYAVLTTKHHDGFCLFDSALTEYKSTNSAAGRDLVREYVDAFRAEGLRIGFYHSLIDWHHPDFVIDDKHPLYRNEEAMQQPRDMAKYRAYLHGQVEELLTNYGQVDYLWFDFSYPKPSRDGLPGKGKEDWGSEELVAKIRKLQPNTLVNDRLDLGAGVLGPEQFQPRASDVKTDRLVEECHTLNISWGYHPDRTEWKDEKTLVEMLIGAVSRGSNFLLNVGPDARGRFEPRAVARLEAYAKWMDLHGETIHGAGRCELTPPDGCLFTQKGDRLFLHVLHWPYKVIHLDSITGKLDFACFVHDGAEIGIRNRETMKVEAGSNTGFQATHPLLLLPQHRPDVLVPVIELFRSDEQ